MDGANHLAGPHLRHGGPAVVDRLSRLLKRELPPSMRSRLLTAYANELVGEDDPTVTEAAQEALDLASGPRQRAAALQILVDVHGDAELCRELVEIGTEHDLPVYRVIGLLNRATVAAAANDPDIAAAVAAELGIDEYHARVMPEDKQDVVKQLRAEGHVVAVVGDGTNDAPALTLADIGIAMGVAGTDVAVETADVALADDDLHALLDLRDLSRRTVRLIRQNYGMSIAVNTAGLLVSAGGALSPVVAAILHNASSVAVVGNSSRLIRHRITPPTLRRVATGLTDSDQYCGRRVLGLA